MFNKRSSRANDQVPRRRPTLSDEDRPSASTTSQFRRNQTLSSYRPSTPEGSARQKAHSLTVQRRKIGGIFMLVACIAVALLLLLWQLIAQVQINTSTKQLTSEFNPATYEKVVNDYFNLNPAQRLRFALDEAALNDYVSTQLPEVEQLSLSGMPGLAQASFTVTFRTPIAGWQIDGDQNYVDANGVVFAENYYDTPTVQIVDESGIPTEQGSASVGTRTLGFVGRVVAEAEGRGYTVTEAVLPLGMTREIDVFFDGVGGRIKLSLDRGAASQIEDADRSIKYLQSRGVGVEYIDVRVEGRAAYR